MTKVETKHVEAAKKLVRSPEFDQAEMLHIHEEIGVDLYELIAQLLADQEAMNTCPFVKVDHNREMKTVGGPEGILEEFPSPRPQWLIDAVYSREHQFLDPYKGGIRLQHGDLVCLVDGVVLYIPANYQEALVRGDDGWRYDMENAPKKSPKGKILLICHDPLSPHKVYVEHAETFGSPEFNGVGVFQAVWGGEWNHNGHSLPKWWFLDDGRFETALNPTAFKLITLPTEEQS